MCPERHGEEQAETGSKSGNYVAEGTRGGLVINRNNKSRKTRRRTSVDWYNQKQVYRGRHEWEGQLLLGPVCQERNGERLAETGSNRRKCSVEGTRRMNSDN